MNDDFLKNLWRGQDLGAPPPLPNAQELTAMRQKMKCFDATIRRRDAGELLAGVVLVVWFGCYYFAYPAPLARLGSVVVILSAIFIDCRLFWSKRAGPKPDSTASVMDTLKAELRKVEIQIGLLKTVLWWYLLPLSVGAMLFYVGLGLSWLSNAAFLGFTVATDAAIYWLNQTAVRRQLLPLKAELQSLLDSEQSTP